MIIHYLAVKIHEYSGSIVVRVQLVFFGKKERSHDTGPWPFLAHFGGRMSPRHRRRRARRRYRMVAWGISRTGPGLTATCPTLERVQAIELVTMLVTLDASADENIQTVELDAIRCAFSQHLQFPNTSVVEKSTSSLIMQTNQPRKLQIATIGAYLSFIYREA